MVNVCSSNIGHVCSIYCITTYKKFFCLSDIILLRWNWLCMCGTPPKFYSFYLTLELVLRQSFNLPHVSLWGFGCEKPSAILLFFFVCFLNENTLRGSSGVVSYGHSSQHRRHRVHIHYILKWKLKTDTECDAKYDKYECNVHHLVCPNPCPASVQVNLGCKFLGKCQCTFSWFFLTI